MNNMDSMSFYATTKEKENKNHMKVCNLNNTNDGLDKRVFYTKQVDYTYEMEDILYSKHNLDIIRKELNKTE